MLNPSRGALAWGRQRASVLLFSVVAVLSLPNHLHAADFKADAETYVVEVKATGTYKHGAAGSYELTLTTKGPYVLNPQYPNKITLTASSNAALTYPKTVIQKSDCVIQDTTKMTCKVGFVASAAGQYTSAGTFSLSVQQTSGNTVMDKVSFNVGLTVN